ncbi:sugar transferase [Microbacterium sp. CFH 31415]|uniref:sugar transferase n=1 Tax=Microbacterium sp. CFH 31415 TaxID=2921732 RepID=UPI001F1440F7|nr:sugar transferase [Microbacterium sp. CFH 31415]MCH6230773.1 sugar transferase [Microbacterium sp. CFH 31415]
MSAAVAPTSNATLENRHRWERAYRRRLRLADTAVVIGSTGVAAWIQIAAIAQVDLTDAPWQYGRVFVLTAAVWLLFLALFQTRSPRVIGQGIEYRRVLHATGMAFGVAAIAFVIMQSQGIRTQLLIALPLGTAAILATRWTSRRWLQRQRVAGHFVSRALVVGNRYDVEYVIDSLQTDGLHAYKVVGVILDQPHTEIMVDGQRYVSVGSIDDVATHAASLGADSVILASIPEGDRGYIKRLTWQLEGAAAELSLSSPLVDVAGPRMSLRPVEGLPLIQVEIPTFEGGRHLAKRAFDIAVASIALVFVAIVTPFVALAIKLESKGPVFFVQPRVGRDGETFPMLKFRSMHVDAENMLHTVSELNEGSGPLFKMKRDPRVTRVGTFLRKFSIDELPQFANVLLGDMSIVGPRPPLPRETSLYENDTYRRLYIRPGITGPWQISGRSHLSWEESVRLDLRYVENWSVTGDMLILLKTVGTVFKAEGAY